MKEIDNFYFQKEEPLRACLSAIRQIILSRNADITEAWKYSMPFFCYKGRMFCYVWIEKKNGCPYLGFVEGNKIEHPGLVQEGRSRMKIFRLDSEKDLPISAILNILDQALFLYTSGVIRTRK